MRVLTFNVQNRSSDTSLVNAELRRLAPDVVALQEVMDAGHLAELLDGTGLRGTHQTDVLGYEPESADTYGGTAIATRTGHEVLTAIDRSLPGDPSPWYALLVDVGEQLLIAPTSSWRLDAEIARERQALAIAELDEQHRLRLPTIIAGDLNAPPDAASVRFLTGLQSLDGRSVHYLDAWAVAGDGPGHTWSTDNPLAVEEIERLVGQRVHRRRIDYVLVGSVHAHPDGRAVIVSAELAPAGLSDHAGVLVELALR